MKTITFWIVFVFCAPVAYATPFDLIVPTAVTINTSIGGPQGGDYSGNIGAFWLAATAPLDLGKASLNVIPASGVSSLVAMTCKQPLDKNCAAGSLALSLMTGARGLSSGDVATTGPVSVITGLDLFMTLLLANERALSPQESMLMPGGSVEWHAPKMEGGATGTYLFAIGQDVARYTATLQFINAPADPILIRISGAQRVSSRFEDDYHPPIDPKLAPEPMTLELCGVGLLFLLWCKLCMKQD